MGRRTPRNKPTVPATAAAVAILDNTITEVGDTARLIDQATGLVDLREAVEPYEAAREAFAATVAPSPTSRNIRAKEKWLGLRTRMKTTRNKLLKTVQAVIRSSVRRKREPI